MDYIYKITLTSGATTICTRKVRTKEEGEFQAKEILKNSKDSIKIEYYIKEGEKNRRNPSKEERICNYILKTYSDIYSKPLKKYPNVSKECVYKATSKLINDIEGYLHIIYNDDRTSLAKGAFFIYQHIKDLWYAIEKHRMDLYNCDYMSMESDDYGF